MSECHLNKGPLQTEHVVFEAVFLRGYVGFAEHICKVPNTSRETIWTPKPTYIKHQTSGGILRFVSGDFLLSTMVTRNFSPPFGEY